MEIIVEGIGKEIFTPNEVIISFDFKTKGLTMEEVLEIGTRNVYDFIQELIIGNGFKKEDLKTRNFIIREEKKYNEATRKYDFDGYSYNQGAILRFDYDKCLLSRFMESLAQLSNPPKSYISFGIKEEQECRRSILTKAFEDAKRQASEIAYASGKQLRDCIKIDFKPFTTSYLSNSGFEGDMMYAKASMGKGNQAEIINNIFTPEDIELTEKLYCLWIAE